MDESEPPGASGAKYIFALLGLLVLTALTFGLHFAPLGGVLGLGVAMIIATIKVSIVATIVMELREAMAAPRIVAVVTVAFLALLCAGIVGDVGMR